MAGKFAQNGKMRLSAQPWFSPLVNEKDNGSFTSSSKVQKRANPKVRPFTFRTPKDRENSYSVN
jgi:hypothetical protein